MGATNRLTGEFLQQLRGNGGDFLAADKSSYLRLEKVGLQAPARGASVRLAGVVADRVYQGSHSTYTIDSHGSRIRALVPEGGAAPLVPGAAATLYIDPTAILQY
ncbi:TOBE domain-containing protein [Cryobacterium sp. PAMC25264]|uniref:TOBE domain-containing protein n=1 Tax=Cryobacterium sp. PAMC25264 TaxID=2861288 RepID=UPI00351D9C07